MHPCISYIYGYLFMCVYVLLRRSRWNGMLSTMPRDAIQNFSQQLPLTSELICLYLMHSTPLICECIYFFSCFRCQNSAQQCDNETELNDAFFRLHSYIIGHRFLYLLFVLPCMFPSLSHVVFTIYVQHIWIPKLY